MERRDIKLYFDVFHDFLTLLVPEILGVKVLCLKKNIFF